MRACMHTCMRACMHTCMRARRHTAIMCMQPLCACSHYAEHFVDKATSSLRVIFIVGVPRHNVLAVVDVVFEFLEKVVGEADVHLVKIVQHELNW